MVHLIIKRPGQPEQREAVPEGEVTIGRAEGNTIVIDDSRISREHAILTPDASGHRIRDLGSRNGTRVNGKQPTAEGQLLRNGDHIALGRSQVLLSYYTEDVTVTAADTSSRWGIPLGWQMQLPSARWRFLDWLRVVGIILAVISGSLGIIFWLTRIIGD
ncbi:MAG: FHA domain-containing protein [Chloroflexi bacterium]|nr:FHA domain-containing protein [Chloroflexota bacterium]